MTNETGNQQNTTPESAGTSPSDAAKATRNRFAGCATVMAEMMKKFAARESENASGVEADVSSQEATQEETGCGCGAVMERMMGRFFKDATTKAGEQR